MAELLCRPERLDLCGGVTFALTLEMELELGMILVSDCCNCTCILLKSAALVGVKVETEEVDDRTEAFLDSLDNVGTTCTLLLPTARPVKFPPP